ncbi:MAG: hypothetical protein KGL12_10440 [Rhodospirillales bacterium]|nr:hypothetical protein [Rhodospirillales bacterium]
MRIFPPLPIGLRATGLIGIAALAGCAAPAPPPPAAALPPARAAEVLVVRPLKPGLAPPAALAPILPNGAGTWPAGLAEIVLRRADGRVVSLMETPPPGLAAGQSVLVVDGQTRSLPVHGS